MVKGTYMIIFFHKNLSDIAVCRREYSHQNVYISVDKILIINRWQFPVKKIMNFQLPQDVRNFLANIVIPNF